MLSTVPKIEMCPDVYPPSEDSELMLGSMKVQPGETVLDMGTGSGILAISAALRGGEVTAVDVSEKALACARANARANAARNAEKNGVLDRMRFIRSDLFENVTGTYDVVLFNPPYLPSEEWSSREQEDQQWDGGGDGSETILAFIDQLGGHLSIPSGDHPGGRCYLLFSSLSGDGEETIRKAVEGRFSYAEVGRVKLSFETLFVVELHLIP